MGKLMVGSLFPSLPIHKKEMCFLDLYTSFINPWMNVKESAGFLPFEFAPFEFDPWISSSPLKLYQAIHKMKTHK